jgi:hypothetical protein
MGRGRGLLLVSVWLALFVATVSVRTLLASSESTDGVAYVHPSSIVISELTRAEFEQLQPRNPLRLNLAGASEDGELVKGVTQFLLGHRAALRDCRHRIMKRSIRPNEYFEVSFVPARGDSADRSKFVVLDDIVVERSSLHLLPGEETCLIGAFSAVTYATNIEFRPHRIHYQFCLKGLQAPESD